MRIDRLSSLHKQLGGSEYHRIGVLLQCDLTHKDRFLQDRDYLALWTVSLRHILGILQQEAIRPERYGEFATLRMNQAEKDELYR